jgi:hypothetical protein
VQLLGDIPNTYLKLPKRNPEAWPGIGSKVHGDRTVCSGGAKGALRRRASVDSQGGATMTPATRKVNGIHQLTGPTPRDGFAEQPTIPAVSRWYGLPLFLLVRVFR